MSDWKTTDVDDPTLFATATQPTPSRLDEGADSPPRVGGRYEILGLLGKGGMGSVYRVRDLVLDEIVALKFLRRELVEAPVMLERFRQEVKLARRVTHRSVARTFDIGEHDGEKFLTMECVDGEPLARTIAREGVLPAGRAVEIGLQICAGLSAAHAAGVIHRDLKPENVLVERSGRVVITDFGLARPAERDGSSNTGGLVVGTPAYMAPEQVEGGAVLDGRADIYALGAVLHELLTGQPAWPGDSDFAVATARLTAKPPDPRARNPGVPAALAETVIRCMGRRPQDRFASASDVAAALEASLRTISPSGARPPPGLSPIPTRALRVAPGPMAGDVTIAVLPFRNAGAGEDDFIVEELTEDLIDTLSITRGLKVRPRSMVARRLAEGTDARDVGRALDVEVVVDGSVRRTGGEIRVTARLISVAEGFQLWAKRFERPAQELLVISDEVARAVVAALLLDLQGQRRAAAPDARTMETYVRARHALRRAWSGIADPVQGAVALFERGLERAPDDPQMLSGYAMARARRFNDDPSDMPGEPEGTRAVAMRAIALAPYLGEPWLALSTLLYVTGDWAGAVKALRTALDRAPGLMKPRKMLGAIQLEIGPLEEGLFQLEMVRSLDPMSVGPRWELGRANALLGRWSLALALLDLPVEHEADRVAQAIVRARLDLWRREARYPIPALDEATTGAGRRGLEVARIFGELVLRGALPDRVAAKVERMAEETGNPRSRFRPVAWQLAAELFAFSGDRDRTANAVRQAVEANLFDLAWLDRCPLLDFVRGEAWFAALRDRVKARVEPFVEALTAPIDPDAWNAALPPVEPAPPPVEPAPPPVEPAPPPVEPALPVEPAPPPQQRKAKAGAIVAPAFVLRREGDYFTVEHAGRTARLKSSVGLDLLARLIERPGEELPALMLAAPAGCDAPLGNAGELLDGDAASAYKERLEDLRDHLREAEELGDRARAARAREEMDALAAELARGLGLGGKARIAGSAAERARVNVQRHIRKAIRKIADEHPDLGRYLDWTIKTGTFCSYRPPE
jgi:serine/threonine-protein kinase